MIDKNFWQGKRVFVTGHTGFKGSWLSLWLTEMGAIVKGYALDAPTVPSLFEIVRLNDLMESHIGDIRDFEKLRNSIAEFKPEIVFHMAAQPLVRLSYEQPIETYSTNVMGTVHLLEAVKQVGNIKAVVNITSDKCYDNREWVWGYRENEPMGGYDPYSNSKGCAELVASAFRNSFFNPANYEQHGVGLASVRAGNVIGGGDWAKDRLIPDILRSFENNQQVIIRNPYSIRPGSMYWSLFLVTLWWRNAYIQKVLSFLKDGISARVMKMRRRSNLLLTRWSRFGVMMQAGYWMVRIILMRHIT